jgi:hypothetical protein
VKFYDSKNFVIYRPWYLGGKKLAENKIKKKSDLMCLRHSNLQLAKLQKGHANLKKIGYPNSIAAAIYNLAKVWIAANNIKSLKDAELADDCTCYIN